MAKSTASATSNKRVTLNVERVKLYDFAYEQSGKVKGDPDVYLANLQQILNGDLVEPDYKGFSDEEKIERIQQIKDLEKELKVIESGNSKITEEIKLKEQEIETHRKEILNIHDKNAKDHEKLKEESFSPLKFTINVFLLAMLSVYLFFFYISAAYKALYVDFEGIAESISEGAGVGSIMPGAYELAEAIQYNYLLFLVPFVFYSFGWAFHILLELKGKSKYVFLSALILVTFMVDFLLAFIIHNNTESAKELMGLGSTHWTSSSTFYIILFLGFLVYIIWSILFDSMLREWDKKQITNNLKKIINHHEKDIKKLEKGLINVESIKKRIEDYREDVSTIMYGGLKKYIDQFSSGWVSYLSPANLKDAKQTCLNLKKEFEDKHNIKSGTVKVVSKRR
jgi:hypothetical protein